jgi:hypothetical protein
LIFFHKEHLGELRVINVAPTCNTHLHRLESLCHQPKMNFASASFDCNFVSNTGRGRKNYLNLLHIIS